MTQDARALVVPDTSFQVDYVDASHVGGGRAGAEIVHLLTDEPRVYAGSSFATLNGYVIKVLTHP